MSNQKEILIVAECNVNCKLENLYEVESQILIVAECNVNLYQMYYL